MVRSVATAATAVLAVAARLLSQEPGAADRAKLDRWPYSLALPEVAREEISFPPVAGFQVLKGDFHVHTFYSDGLVSPEVRVVEAWRDGLDVLALTDHSEYLDVAIPYDRERAYGRALPVAKQLGLLLARGAELSQISSKPPVANPSDFVVHFLADEGKLFGEFDAGLRAARAQGSTVVWAHPGPDWRPIAETLAGRGWLDGIELRNGVLQGRAGTRRVAGAWLWPQVMDWCLARDLAIFASSDAHWPIDFMYDRARGERRDMTLLLARSRDLEAVREAIRARRTLACFGGTLWGKEPWLRELARASLDLRFPPPSGIPSRLRYSLLAANRSSLELRVKLAAPGAAFPEREFRVPPGPATAVPFDLRPEGRTLRSLDLTITVVNLFSGLDRPLVLEAKLELPR